MLYSVPVAVKGDKLLIFKIQNLFSVIARLLVWAVMSTLVPLRLPTTFVGKLTSCRVSVRTLTVQSTNIHILHTHTVLLKNGWHFWLQFNQTTTTFYSGQSMRHQLEVSSTAQCPCPVAVSSRTAAVVNSSLCSRYYNAHNSLVHFDFDGAHNVLICRIV